MTRAEGLPLASLPMRLRWRSGASVLTDRRAGDVHGWTEAAARAALKSNREKLNDLQFELFQKSEAGLLVVLQAMDTAGKDGTIRHVMSAFNPQGCHVRPFKVPSEEERAHDFLWRVHPHAPAKGHVAVFNRSHYEAVLVERVDAIAPRKVWFARYEHINAFERMLADSGTQVVKIFLHISRAEQKRRLEKRRKDPAKQWKWDPGDVRKHAQWGQYIAAYRDVLRHCSPAAAPWYSVPSDHKWFRNLAVSQILRDALESMVPGRR